MSTVPGAAPADSREAELRCSLATPGEEQNRVPSLFILLHPFPAPSLRMEGPALQIHPPLATHGSEPRSVGNEGWLVALRTERLVPAHGY